MSNEDILTDDYVAGLLSQEASECSIKYSAMGVDAFLGKGSDSKKPTHMPKPNTRFLRNIIKGTDTHNKALLAKEAAESRARLKRLERADEVKRKKSNPTIKDIRERHIGDIQAIVGGGKRRARDGDNDSDTKERDSRGHGKSKRKSGAYRSENVYGGGDHDRWHKDFSLSGDQSESPKRHGCRRDDKRRSRYRDHSSDVEYPSRRNKNSRGGRSKSPRNGSSFKRTRSRDADRRHHRHRSPLRNRSPVSAENEGAPYNSQDEEIGPAPPLKIRGRGAVGASSGIDRRFSASYDPKTDIQDDG